MLNVAANDECYAVDVGGGTLNSGVVGALYRPNPVTHRLQKWVHFTRTTAP